ncbi:hypothetical protein E0J16_00065 [Rhizobium pisi]|uniref:hypothetical protein n=1 Tax=Rhizobium pisi TaxID=574561 RepID=UPI00103BA230|nr:hypothetical protein [Rhizobium pisi]TCA62717.1 hypothetical protein E0J16_00065 [Rhizobium pisi]
MDIHEALDAWAANRLTVKELFMATGFRSVANIYREVLFDCQDIENEREFSMAVEIAEMDQAELEAHALEKWDDFLKEEPGYLEACVRMLRHQIRLDREAIGRRLSKAAANRIN